MADTKISDMTAAVSVADADLVPVVQGGVNKKATVDLILDALTAARVATAIGSTAANLVYAGPASGASAVPAARALVPDDIPASLPLTKLAALTIDRALVSSGAGVVSVSSVTATELGYVSGVTSAIQTQLNAKQGLDATLTALAALDSSTGFLQQTAADTFVKADLTAGQINTALTYTAADAAALNATNLTSGTVPDARFPAVLPAISGANLTNLPGGISGLTTNVLPVATSATAIANSKWTMSGTNLGTATLYDDTAVTGKTLLTVRGGPGQGTDYVATFRDDALTKAIWLTLNGYGAAAHFSDDGANVDLTVNSSVGINLSGEKTIGWCDYGPYLYGANTVGLAWGGSGILKITDGSTGFGSLRAASVGAQTANGAICNVKSISESITLDTGALFTDSAADLLPANSVIRSVVARITTTITTSTDWALGDPTSSARFASANATLTAGTTTIGLNHRQGSVATDALGPVQTAAAKLRITLTGANPGAGVVRVTVFYEEFTAPTS